ncbi:MAG: hypothetical protein LAT68_12035 [Cyclobacteriaceae bacterium]|nr:hypothetical protein [Cyclobacteriaceae bacterium]MCH8517046.1 hypothetical protein [Cyclobacteriaceae bacterium]
MMNHFTTLKPFGQFLVSLLFLVGMSTQIVFAQNELAAEDVDSTIVKPRRVIEELTYETASGLPMAASKIYFSDRKFTASGFGEVNYINYRGPKDVSSGDLELYMTNLYRFVSYLAYKPTPWLILYGEVFGELLQDRQTSALEVEYFLEFFADFLIDPRFNVRVGTHQVQLGYLNNHDEPIMFYSVNRPEVERLIIPSQWIDLGVMTYGNITSDLSWTFSVYQGLDASNYNGGTWIRRGRDEELRFNAQSIVLNSMWTYSGIKDTKISASGIWTEGGNNETIQIGDSQTRIVSANTWLTSAYVRHEAKNWTLMALGSYGNMQDTEGIFALTDQLGGEGQVLGSEVYGYYLEAGYDILPFLRSKRSSNSASWNNYLFRSKEMKLPIFARFEQLNTHLSVADVLQDENRFQRDMTTLTVGANFNTRKNFVFKANYQFRWNEQPMPNGEFEGDRVELGLGFIF